MGLIKSIMSAASGTFADQWKEFFYCDAMERDVLVVKGQKRVSGRSSNTKGSENVITNGSAIAVADGQCMIIVEQGKVVEFCAEPGEYKYDSELEPSIFSGDLGESIMNTFKEIGARFTYGGDVAKDQRVYYFNTKELLENKFGTPNPIPFRVVDRRVGIDIDVAVRCSGMYSYKIVNPLLFYTNVCGNIEREYRRSEIETQMKAEFITALQPAFAKISEMEVRPSALPAHAMELADAMNEALTKKWKDLRGLQIVSVSLNPITLTEEDAEMIKNLQRESVYRDPGMAAATLVGAQAKAMEAAANNSAGAMMGFMGMNMASQAGGMNANQLYGMAQQQQQQAMQQQAMQQQAAPAPSNAEETWPCSCGANNTGKFCMECGNKKPEEQAGWPCSCGTVNKGKFCMECGNKKPADAPLYCCDKCGWEPEDPKNPPKFCPECGDLFDEKDVK